MTSEQSLLPPTTVPVPVPDVNLTNDYLQIRQPSLLHIPWPKTSSNPTNFTEYIEDLDAWEYDLIQGCEFVIEEDICIILWSQCNLHFISNGEEESSLGYFGCMISIDIDILAQHNGHATGNSNLIESLHTKSIDALSLLLFIPRFCT
eukprot:13643048-Ditylum_brightwellii.AAC.1